MFLDFFLFPTGGEVVSKNRSSKILEVGVIVVLAKTNERELKTSVIAGMRHPMPRMSVGSAGWKSTSSLDTHVLCAH